jgi:copper chaperone NosL
MNRNVKLTMFMLVIMVVLVAGCSSAKLEATAINENVDKCEVCNMQVNDDEFATQLITEEGKVYKFDDLGCMNEWKVKNGTDEIAIEFVRDQASSEWVKMDNAYFAYDPSFKSPMAYGIVSFKDKSSAERFITEQGKGKLMSASDLHEHTWDRNKGSIHMEMGEGHEGSAHKESSAKGTH